MKIAVEGCMHGDLDNVYRTLQYYERVHKTKLDLLLCCGDFQAVRNEKDLESLNVPIKYRSMNSFWKYYSGEEVAPYPTIFISGNHELPITCGNWHFGRPPYNDNTIRSIYYVHKYEVRKLLQVEEPIDIFLSHDWPLGITDCGDCEQLVRLKPFFEQEIQERRLGSKAAAGLLEKLKPPYWFSARLRCKFAARVQHGEGSPVTNFLALDKCLPGRKFLQIIEIESALGPYEIQYDEEWLAITRRFNSIFPLTRERANCRSLHLDMQDCRHWVRNKLPEKEPNLLNFQRQLRVMNTLNPAPVARFMHKLGILKQSFLQLLELPYLLDNTTESLEVSNSPISFIHRDIPFDDVDESEEVAEDDL